MRKLSFTLVLIAISFMTIEASISRHEGGRSIDFKKWNRHSKNIIPIPIEATIEDNNIEVQFFVSQDYPVTFQVKDSQGNIVFQEMAVPNEQESYQIKLDDLKTGQYELLYLDEDKEFIGEFDIEHNTRY